MKQRRATEQPIDPSQLASGYMFPELFADPPFRLVSQEADDSPFAPSSVVQHTMPDLPSVDWDHIRRKHAEQRRMRRRNRKA